MHSLKSSSATCAQNTHCLTHHRNQSSLKEEIEKLSHKISQRGDLSYISVDAQLKILQDLASFSLGQFLIQNKGLNGYWTDYILKHPSNGKRTGINHDGQTFSEWENFLLNNAPVALATQERFALFQEELQKQCRENVSIASIPCGLMGDLLSLDFHHLDNYELIGVDIDEESLKEASLRISDSHVKEKTRVFQDDAWSFSLPQPVDVITSNGLNIYEQDNTRVVELYRQFYNNLKPGGILITSFLTPPPTLDPDSEWKMSAIDHSHAFLQKVIFSDILGGSWQAYRSSTLTTNQLTEVGFTEVRILPGKTGIFPTVIASRPYG